MTQVISKSVLEHKNKKTVHTLSLLLIIVHKGVFCSFALIVVCLCCESFCKQRHPDFMYLTKDSLISWLILFFYGLLPMFVEFIA